MRHVEWQGLQGQEMSHRMAILAPVCCSISCCVRPRGPHMSPKKFSAGLCFGKYSFTVFRGGRQPGGGLYPEQVARSSSMMASLRAASLSRARSVRVLVRVPRASYVGAGEGERTAGGL